MAIEAAGRILEVKRQLEQGPRPAQAAVLDRLFPNADPALKEKALTLSGCHLFIRERLLQPHLAFLNQTKSFLITDEARFESLRPELQVDFQPVLVLESRSHRARFWTSPEGRVIEFKGLTPQDFDETNINHNSGQPQGLLEVNPAQSEKAGLDIVGAVDCGVTELGEYFGDLVQYAQLYRRARDTGDRYFPWLRLDIKPAAMQVLAELEGVSFETFLQASCRRFGEQLKTLHRAGRTLHAPFSQPGSRPEPFFSFLHSGNVEIHGNIIDLEGTRSFAGAERDFREHLKEGEKRKLVGEKYLAGIENGEDFEIFCRLADLHRFISGNQYTAVVETSLFGSLYVLGGSPDNFNLALSGVIRGYYADSGAEAAVEKFIEKDLIPYLTRNHLDYQARKTTLNPYFPFGITHQVFSYLENDVIPAAGTST